MSSLKQALESQLAEVLSSKDPDSIHRYTETLVDNLIEQQQFSGYTGQISAEIRYLGEKMDARAEAVDKRFEALDKRFEEQRIHSDKRFEALDKRFEEQRIHSDKRFDDLIHHSDKRFEDMNKRFDDLQRRSNLYFVVITAGLTVLGLILSYGTFVAA